MFEGDEAGTQAATPDQNSRSALFSTTAATQVVPVVNAAAQRYELLGEIARGGMGAVYRAWDTVLQRDVAVKVIHAGHRLSLAALRRFEYEARVTAHLQHPSILPVYDQGTLADGRPFLAMKLIHGQTLHALLKARPYPAHDRGRFVAVFESICQAVGFAHTNGVLHRDLKPLNVMVGSFGEVQVMDWGVAKFRADADAPADAADPPADGERRRPLPPDDTKTQAGAVLGTPAYMPPEQAAGANDRVTERSDVFGLGAILCTILTGHPPFVGDTAEDTRLMAAGGRVEAALGRLDACGAEPLLIALAKQCLAVNPDDRPANGSAVAAEVAKLRAAAEQRAKSAEVAKATSDARRRILTIAAAVVTVVLGSAVVVSVRQAVRATDAEARTAQQLLRAEEAEREEAEQLRLTKEAKKLAEEEHQRSKAAEAKAVLAERATAAQLALTQEAKKLAEEAKKLAEDEQKRSKLAEQKAVAAEMATATQLALTQEAKKLAEDEGKRARDAEAKAVRAADAAKAANELTQKRLAQIERTNAVVFAIFEDVDVRRVRQDGEPLEAALAKRLTKIARDLDGEAVGEPLTVADLQGRLGQTLLNLGYPQDAIPLFTKAHATQAARLGEDSPAAVTSTAGLAAALDAAGRLDQALPLYDAVLARRTARLGRGHPDTLRAIGSLAAAYADAGQTAKALPLLQECFDRTRDALGENHVDTLAAMNNLALGFRAGGQLPKAIALYEDALARKQKALGPDHPDTLAGMNNLALAYDAAGQSAKGLPLLEETLRLKKAALGHDHPSTLKSMHNLALGYQSAGRTAAALSLLQDTLRLRKVRLGLDHPGTLSTLDTLGAVYQIAGQPAKAADALDEALRLKKAKLGPDHPGTLATLTKLAAARVDARQPAVAAFEDFVEAFADARRGEKLVPLFDAFLRQYKERGEPTDAEWAATTAHLAAYLLEAKQWAAAERLARDSFAAADGPAALTAKSRIGQALLGRKQYAAAEPLLRAAFDGQRPAADATAVVETGVALARLYAATGRPAEAAAVRVGLPHEAAPPPREAK